MKKLGIIRLFICLAAIITELLPLGAVLKYGLMGRRKKKGNYYRFRFYLF